MSTKALTKDHQPSWTEVILGAVLSVALGAVLGAVLLILKPLAMVKELPKEGERVAGVIYYIEGSHDTGKARQAVAKRKLFTQGKSVNVTEDEINSLAVVPPKPGATPAPPPAPAPKAKKGEKAAPPPPAGPVPDGLTVGVPNFRIRDGAVQLAVPVTLGLLGLDQRMTVLTRGAFAKKGETFTFVPETLYVGSCPVQRLPFAAAYVTQKFLAAQAVPEDIAAMWPKLAEVSVDGSTLKLAMP
ncbi:MAG: hypothetical protein EXS32_12185 [Opitutus sp.]|nr:hypothetical protein [Opitutus sp.]